ncbi:MAG: ATP-binding protein [Deltaproteobacteria bacterium]|nr:ATP-binding protein [Myxococcales bacterium]MDP3216111.1 ATP-binding protein [Deltaproteobacteria bacterium]
MRSDSAPPEAEPDPAAAATKRAEQARERIALLGTLAAGVTHEINNPLTYVIASLDQALEEVRSLVDAVPSLHGTLAIMQEARDGAERAWLVARDVRTFSRREPGAVGPVDLRRVLDATVRIARHDVSARATLVQDYLGVPPVTGSEVALGQVFLNLVMNAAQAIPPGDPQRNRIRIHGREELGRVIVEVSDTGEGIAPDVIERIFDPFFTTKAEGLGTGLGLSITHEIVRSLGGVIEVTSEPGRGTTFTVSLGALPRESVRSSRPPSRMGRVLVVDDDPLVAEAVRQALSSENHVAVASTGSEALAMVSRGVGFDAIFCDLMMPEMDGMRFYDEVAQVAGSVTEVIAFLSGGVDDAATGVFLARTGRPVLEKPFDPEGLREYVRVRVRGAAG